MFFIHFRRHVAKNRRPIFFGILSRLTVAFTAFKTLYLESFFFSSPVRKYRKSYCNHPGVGVGVGVSVSVGVSVGVAQNVKVFG